MKSMSKRQLAVELGISINTLEKWWRRREPSPDHAAKLLKLLHEDGQISTAAPDQDSGSPGGEPSAVVEVTGQGYADEEKVRRHEALESSRELADRSSGSEGDNPAGEQLVGVSATAGVRCQERSVVVSLGRTRCPFCEHDIIRFHSCGHCGCGPAHDTASSGIHPPSSSTRRFPPLASAPADSGHTHRAASSSRR